MTLRRGTLRLAACAIEQRLNADTSDELGSRIPCRCGGEAHFVGRRPKQFHSALGIENTSLSPAVTRMTATVGALVSFQEELLQELAGVAVDAKQVERTAEALGEEIAQDEHHHSEPLDAVPLPKTLYLGIDGTGIPLRAEELAGVSGKSAAGAKTREVKLCTIWSAESFDADGIPIRDEGPVSYSAAIESASIPDLAKERSPFAQRVWREAQRRRFPGTVTLGDGAPWIWNLVEELFPEALQIVDRFHAKQHLSELSKALYGPAHPRAAQWAKRRQEELDGGKFRALLAALRRQMPRSEEARRCLHYFQTNRERMRYPEFQAQGLCTSTGVVEAGCKVAIGTRLKRAGMHWTVRGSNAIIALRCSKLSGRFQDFWERRSERLAA